MECHPRKRPRATECVLRMNGGHTRYMECTPCPTRLIFPRSESPSPAADRTNYVGARREAEGQGKGLAYMIIAMGIAETVGLFGFIFVLLMF